MQRNAQPVYKEEPETPARGEMVRTKRLELLHLAALEPKSSVSTNSTTSARGQKRKRQAMPGASEYGVDDGNRTHDTRSHNPVLYQLSYAHHIALRILHLTYFTYKHRLVARPAGFEPATTRLEGGCSIRLSYGRLMSELNLSY